MTETQLMFELGRQHCNSLSISNLNTIRTVHYVLQNTPSFGLPTTRGTLFHT